MGVFRASGRGRWLEEREHPQEKKEHRQGGGRSPEVCSQIFNPHQPTGHRRFCRALRVTSTAQLSTRRSWSMLPSKSKHPRRLLLPAALLMLLPCLELIIVAHQLLAKPYSKVVTVAFKGRGAILNLLLLLDGGAQLYYNHVFGNYWTTERGRGCLSPSSVGRSKLDLW